jgi:hypothetical protein
VALRRLVGGAARECKPVVYARKMSTSLCEPHASMPLHEAGASLAGAAASCSAGRHDLLDVSMPIRRNISANSGELDRWLRWTPFVRQSEPRAKV